MAFLLPIMHRVLKLNPRLADPMVGRRRAAPDDIRAIVISPTRELAEQIAVEARRLAIGTGLRVQTAVGGTQKQQMLRSMQFEGCHILVATPGRLQDILDDPYSRVAAPQLDALVLDEADRLLDDGFLKEIENIKTYLPQDEKYQTMMFSATIKKSVVHLVRQMLKPSFKFVQCVSEDEVPTHDLVTQKTVITSGLENRLPALYQLCQNGVQAHRDGQARPFKAIVFFSTTAEVKLAHALFWAMDNHRGRHPLSPANILHIHGLLNQGQRTMAANTFRNSQSAILLSSDVTARGMDFPDVTHVIQVGLPKDRETYIHRLGRTARAGKEGEGWLIISEVERRPARSRLPNLPIQKDETITVARVNSHQLEQHPKEVSDIIKSIRSAIGKVDPGLLGEMYSSRFSHLQHLRPDEVVEAVNQEAKYGWGMNTPPAITARRAASFGVANHPDINIQSASAGRSQGRSRFRTERDDHRNRAMGYSSVF